MDYALQNLKKTLKETVEKVKELKELVGRETDPEIKGYALEEIKNLTNEEEALKASLISLTSSKNQDETLTSGITADSAIIEVRAGTGGDEAGLFAGDLFSMYARFCDKKGWKVSEISRSGGPLPGEIRSVSAEINGKDSYKLLKNESGVHRVQRVPTTESSGRIHTSTATVAVLPVVPPQEVEIKSSDIKLDFFHSGGHGGQNVNKVETGVRIKHLPTGVIAESQEQRTQGQNKEKALQVLRSRLYEMMQNQHKNKVDELRSGQIGRGERSEKIRTFNFPQDRVTDHRLKESWHGIESLLLGNIDEIVQKTASLGDITPLLPPQESQKAQ